MSGRPHQIRQADLTRALRAAKAAGLEVAGFTIEPDGRVVIQTGGSSGEEQTSPLDRWMADHAHQA